ncbi:MAG: RNase adapter RapZ [bacterium]
MKFTVVILTGLSGSGKTVALRALEDCGYFCTDNLPPALIDDFIRISASEEMTSLAVGIDIREKSFLQGIEQTIGKLKSLSRLEVVFLEAETEILLRRFKETRRPHPLAAQYRTDIKQSIEHEIVTLKPLRDLSDRIIDTSSFTPHQLRDTIRSIYCSPARDTLNIVLTSFGFKFGVPVHADLVFDVRFLPNPHFVADLRDLTGRDSAVRDYVFAGGDAASFLDHIKGFLDFMVPRYIREGKSYLNICIGCTGGKHRSVAVVEALAGHMTKFPARVEIIHRDI